MAGDFAEKAVLADPAGSVSCRKPAAAPRLSRGALLGTWSHGLCLLLAMTVMAPVWRGLRSLVFGQFQK